MKLIQWKNSAGGNDHYFVETPTLFWDQAEALAVAYGGQLADIANEAENEFLRSTFATTSERWIGLNDQASENTFVWTSGLSYNPAVFTKFNGTEPNGSTIENVVELVPDGTWNDLSVLIHRRRAILEFNSAEAASTFVNTVAGVVVGGVSTTDGNLIHDNGGTGVAVLGGTGGTAIRGNSIYNNTRLGIDLNGNGATANDAGDTDIGTNGLQNWPVLAIQVTGSGAEMIGTLDSTPDTSFEIDVFFNDVLTAAETEGKQLLFSTTVTANASGIATFSVPRQAAGTRGFITATATDPLGNTSEFSNAIAPLTTGPDP